MKILAEKDGLILARQDDDIRTLGEMLLMASYTKSYAKEQLWYMVENCRHAIEAGMFGVVYRRDVQKSQSLAIPVGFFLWGMLSEPMDAVWRNQLRVLTGPELRSGQRLVVSLAVFPYSGYFDAGLELFWANQPNHDEAAYLRFDKANPGEMRVGVIKKTKG